MVLLTRAVVLAVHTMALEILFYYVCVLRKAEYSP